MSGGFGNSFYGASPYGMGDAETVVSNWSPFLGSPLQRLDVVHFDVTNDAFPILECEVSMYFASGDVDPVFVNGKFTERYRRGSARIPLLNGYHFILRRTGGWAASAIGVTVKATDLAQ